MRLSVQMRFRASEEKTPRCSVGCTRIHNRQLGFPILKLHPNHSSCQSPPVISSHRSLKPLMLDLLNRHTCFRTYLLQYIFHEVCDLKQRRADFVDHLVHATLKRHSTGYLKSASARSTTCLFVRLHNCLILPTQQRTSVSRLATWS